MHEARELAKAVTEAAPDAKRELLFERVRHTSLPYAWASEADIAAVFDRAFDALFILGEASLPLAVSLTMHMYMSAAIATIPLVDAASVRRRQRFVQRLVDRRLLVGVSSFGNNVHQGARAPADVTIAVESDHWLLSGQKHFQSMARAADQLTVTGRLPSGALAFFVVDARQPRVAFGEPVFEGPMALTDTRPVVFDAVRIDPEDVLAETEELSMHLCSYSTSWFEALIAAPYLGAASRALAEVRAFGASARLPEGGLLRDLDGFLVDVGRLAIRLRASLALARGFGPAVALAIGRWNKADKDPLPFVRAWSAMSETSSVIKYACNQEAESIVHACRKLIGTRALRKSHPLAELSGQIVFAPLHPALPAEFERIMGRKVLSDAPWDGLLAP